VTPSSLNVQVTLSQELAPGHSTRKGSRLSLRDPSTSLPISDLLTQGVIPSSIGDPIAEAPIGDFTLWDPDADPAAGRHRSSLSSVELLDQLRRRGITHSEVTFPQELNYSFLTNVGRPPYVDNRELIRGAVALYSDVAHLRTFIPPLAEMRTWLLAQTGDVPEELEDATKLSIQRRKGLGWFLVPPVADVASYDVSPRWVAVARQVVARFRAARTFNQTFLEAAVMDTDPLDTNPGYPSAMGGDQSMLARMLTASGCESISPLLERPSLNTVRWWFNQSAAAFARAGFSETAFGSSIINSRFGPTRKPTIHWAGGSGAPYYSTGGSIGLFPRIRAVYIVPFFSNYLCSKLVLELKSARQHIPGLWHDPESQAGYAQYIRSLRYSARFYESDLSGMDTRFTSPYRLVLLSLLLEAGFDPLGLHVLTHCEEERGGILYPSWLGSTSTATMLKGPMGLQSGWKVTSDLGSLYALVTTLVAMDTISPGYLSSWLSGDELLLIQGDDVLVITSRRLSVAGYPDALQLSGARGELKEGRTFLRKMVSVDASAATPTYLGVPLLSRLLQQTFFNEAEVGHRVIAKIGLQSRALNVDAHPLWPAFSRPFLELLGNLRAFNSDRAPLSEWTSRDTLELQIYLNAHPGFIMRLVASAAFQPSSAQLVAQILAVGVDISSGLMSATDFRKKLTTAFLSPSDGPATSALYARVAGLPTYSPNVGATCRP